MERLRRLLAIVCVAAATMVPAYAEAPEREIVQDCGRVSLAVGAYSLLVGGIAAFPTPFTPIGTTVALIGGTISVVTGVLSYAGVC